MEITLIWNYEKVFDTSITKKHILIATTLLFLYVVSLRAMQYLICDPVTDEIWNVFLKPIPEASQGMRDIYITPWVEAFKLKLQLDNIPEREAILRLMEKYPFKYHILP